MKVVAISMVRNEADVIEAFVRHHAELVDELIVVDHSSIDGTTELLGGLASEGLPLAVRREVSPAQRQNAVLTELMREAAAGGADWIVPLDGDEFLLAPGSDLHGSLARLPPRPHTAELRLYVPSAGDPEGEPNVLRRIRNRRLAEPRLWLQKVVVPAGSASDPGLVLAQGSHALVEAGSAGYLPADTGPLAIAHFPVRSPEQLARKVLGGWPANLARPDRRRREAWQWKRAFDAVAAGEHLAPGALEALALDWGTENPGEPGELVLDPVPVTFALRYRPPSPPSPLEVLAATAEALADELCAARRSETVEEPVSA